MGEGARDHPRHYVVLGHVVPGHGREWLRPLPPLVLTWRFVVRFVSPKGQRIVVVHEDWEILASGQPRVKAPGYTVEFKQGANAHDRDVARQSFTWTGTQRDESGHPIDPIEQDRVWVFDTGSIENAHLKETVEKALTQSPEFGREYVLVEAEHVPAPYAKYDEHRKTIGRRTVEHAIADITAAYEAGGFDIDQAIAYEQLNGASADILAALEGLRATAEPQQELVNA